MQEQPAVMMNKLATLTKNVLLAHGKAVRSCAAAPSWPRKSVWR